MYNIAVSGVGGGVGQSILKSLENSGYNIIALDGEVLAPGLYASKSSYLIPYANNPDYIASLLDIFEREKVDLFFPGLDAELMPLALNKDLFSKIGTTVVVSSPEVIEISDNKLQTYIKLTEAGVTVPTTVDAKDFDLNMINFPIIIKQKVGGARSKNIFLAKNEDEWNAIRANMGTTIDKYIVMEYIEGDEYTCGSVNLDNMCKGVIVMRRILRDGDTHKCFSVKDELIEQSVRRVVEAIKPFGACNVQLRVKDNVPYIFEINARCSGTTASRTLCGFNEPKMIADFILKGLTPNYTIEEKTILRYWKEHVVENNLVSHLKSTGHISQEHYSAL
ncbi:ATP-grasp domain-containing protein [Pedobacter chitinilyticus]|uniref:ATP-grasp domain-containing protein n=1 Tax=Pedobacter chitinilyticus TaxID=2233776 RepID=A0A3S3PMP7_9SPHI|nr:ATP-grasp domain-containing protein [Pedobacter chitinilyticus]RWU05458.1 ATP-grasp domain-containing protein [Pedobacter chitinilyticus]